MRWFRFYDDALNDPKVQRLPATLFKTWINLLCLASKHDGTLPDVADLAFALRRDEVSVDADLQMLAQARLIDVEDGVRRPHNWDKWQYKSDLSTPRTRAWKQRMKERPGNVIGNGEGTVQNRTESESESDTESDPESDQNKLLCADAPARGTRLAKDWVVSAALQAWVKKKGLRVDWQSETEQFRDYWWSKAGVNGRKMDWDKTWQVWMRTAESRLPRDRSRSLVSSAAPDDEAQWRRRLEGFKANRLWLDSWGEKPGEPSCGVPRALLIDYGFPIPDSEVKRW